MTGDDTTPVTTGDLRVVQIVTTLARGGAQATVVASSALSDRGVDVTVLAGRSDTEEGTFWGSADLAPASVVSVPGLVRSPSPVADLRALVWLIGWLRVNRPDVVHTHSSKAGVLGRLAAAAAGVPCAHTVHGWGPLHSSSPAVVRMATAVERLLAAVTAKLVVVGRCDREFGLSRGIGDVDSYRVIRSGVDITVGTAAAREREAIRRRLGLCGRFVVGKVARLSHPKDHRTLIDAFDRAAIPDSVLLLIGDGPNRSAIETMTREAGIDDRLIILGSRTDAARLVAAFDVSVLSSRWEGMPRAVVEAAAASVPIIATDVGSVGELVEDGVSGRLVPVGDAEAMGAALRAAHLRPTEYRALAVAAAERVDEFSAERMRDALASLWFELSMTAPVREVVR